MSTMSGSSQFGWGAPGIGRLVSMAMGHLLFHHLQVVEGEGPLVLAIALDEDGADALEVELPCPAEAIPFEAQRLQHGLDHAGIARVGPREPDDVVGADPGPSAPRDLEP